MVSLALNIHTETQITDFNLLFFLQSFVALSQSFLYPITTLLFINSLSIIQPAALVEPRLTHKVFMDMQYEAISVIFRRLDQMTCRNVVSKNNGCQVSQRMWFEWRSHIRLSPRRVEIVSCLIPSVASTNTSQIFS